MPNQSSNACTHTNSERERKRQTTLSETCPRGGHKQGLASISPLSLSKSDNPVNRRYAPSDGRRVGHYRQSKKQPHRRHQRRTLLPSFFFLSSSPFHDAPARSLAVAAQLKLLLIFNPGIKFNPHTQTHTRTRYRRTKFRGLVHRSSMSSPALSLSGRSVGKSRRLNARWIKESETLNVNTDEQKTKTCFFFTLIIPLLLSCWETRC